MNELFLDESTKHLSKLLLDVTRSIGGTIWEQLKEKERSLENYFYTISSKYLTRFNKRYGFIQILGMNEPMSLSNVFVDVRILDSLSNAKYLSIEDLKKNFLNKDSEIRNLQGYDQFKHDGIQYAEVEKRLMVVGAPGGGKSTYLRKIAIEALMSKSSILKAHIPLMIELKNMDQSHTIESLLLEELIISDFPEPVRFLESSLKNGKLLVLFDGLDEVATELESDIIRDIRNFCDKYHKNRFIVSCRVAAYKGGLTNFRNIEIANLDESQIEDFITKWFLEKNKGIPTNLANRCWESINSPEYKATLELAQTPLLLTLLCLVYYYQQDFPKNRSLLYREAINVLLKEWNAEKRIHSNAVYKDMTLPFEELLLSNIAYNYFLKNEYFFDKQELSNFISDFISNNLNAPKYLDGSQILDAISVQQGILVERAKNIYSFSHLTFQEYFTAKFIDDHNLLNDIVDRHLLQPKWREIFILLCGIMKAGADTLLAEINSKSFKELNDNPDYSNILGVINRISSHEKLEHRLIDLILYIFFATDFPIKRGNNTSIILYVLREIDTEMYQKLANSWIVDQRSHVQMHYELYVKLLSSLKKESKIADILEKTLLDNPLKNTDEISKEFCKNLRIGYTTISRESAENIESYLKNIYFLFQCKKSAILVSRDKWQLIENSLFRIA